MRRIVFSTLIVLAGLTAMSAINRIWVTQIRPPGAPSAPMTITALPDGSVSWQPFPAVPGQPNYADSETPAGTVDGVNAAFTLAHAPNPAQSLHLHRNGIRLTAGADYTLAGASITFVSGAIPEAGALLTADYRF